MCCFIVIEANGEADEQPKVGVDLIISIRGLCFKKSSLSLSRVCVSPPLLFFPSISSCTKVLNLSVFLDHEKLVLPRGAIAHHDT